jgi:hypothetical protein
MTEHACCHHTELHVALCAHLLAVPACCVWGLWASTHQAGSTGQRWGLCGGVVGGGGGHHCLLAYLRCGDHNIAGLSSTRPAQEAAPYRGRKVKHDAWMRLAVALCCCTMQVWSQLRRPVPRYKPFQMGLECILRMGMEEVRCHACGWACWGSKSSS